MVQITRGELFVRDIRTRMPFRYGIAAMTQVPHVVLRLELETEGAAAQGLAAESLAPKWFTKDAASPYRDDIRDMLAVIGQALDQARAAGPRPDPFHLWADMYEALNGDPELAHHPPLLKNLGTSLVERALIDASCRVRGQTLAQVLRTDGLGFQGGYFHAALEDARPGELVPDRPLRTLRARHTIGLGDPLWEDEVDDGERVDDGLPQSLEAVIRTYGVDHFKIKIGGVVEEDIARMHEIAALLTRLIPTCRFTLDGNEQYQDFESFLEFWTALEADAALRTFLRGLLFIEQPLHRDRAMQAETTRALREWRDHPPVIIDESDGDIHGLASALDCGYQGTSHKNCKGIFKSVANLGRLRQLRDADPDRVHVLSGEDLTNVGPVALPQDLAVLANLGITHAERNGHHYFTGLSMHAEPLQRRMRERHADLYHWHAWSGGRCAAVNIQRGEISLESVTRAPFGYAGDMALEGFTALADWQPSLYA